MTEIEVLDLPGDNHGESPVWIQASQELAWVEMFENSRIRIFHPESGRIQAIDVPGPISGIAPLAGGSFIAAMDEAFRIVSRTGEISLFAKPERFTEHELLNDGRCDSKGRFVCASMDRNMKEAIGKLYRADPDGSVHVLDEGFVVGNGIAFSPNEDVLYVADSRGETVWRYDYDIQSGEVSNKSRFFSSREILGRPDGAAVDTDGNYWSALFTGGAVICIDHETGKILSRIELPVLRPTMCAFGGRDLATLFVTTSRYKMSEADISMQPLAGSIFAIDGTNAQGICASQGAPRQSRLAPLSG